MAKASLQKSGKAAPTSPKKTLTEFGQRMAELIEKVGGLVEAGRIAGVQDEAVARWRDERAKAPLHAIVALCEAADFSINWLATGAGTRDSFAEASHVATRTQQEQTSMQRVDPITLDPSEMRLVPVLDVRASAGTGIVAHSEEVAAFVAFTESYLRDIGVNPKFSEILQVSGRSMLPTLADRDWVLIDRSIDKVLDEALYAVVYGGMVLVKRVRLSRDGSVTLCSDNKVEGYEDELIRPSDLHTLNIVGRVKAHCRPL